MENLHSKNPNLGKLHMELKILVYFNGQVECYTYSYVFGILPMYLFDFFTFRYVLPRKNLATLPDGNGIIF
jgi:hypothetical protein